MDGWEYEKKCAKYLEEQGFTNVSVTPGSGDQGIDVIAYKDGKKYGVQCKYYEGSVGNKAIQEAFAGAAYYKCDVPMVITNSTFTRAALTLAKKTGVIVWENIDAICLQKSSAEKRMQREAEENIDYKKLTKKEKDELDLKRIEKYLEEKYQALQAKYPKDTKKNAEVTAYIAEQKLAMEQFKKDYTGTGKKRSDHVERNWRLKRMLEQISNDGDRFVTSGLSEYSVSRIIKLINSIFELGVEVGLNWSTQYIGIIEKWKDIEEDLPKNVMTRDKKAEESAKEKAVGTAKLERAKKELKKQEDFIKIMKEGISLKQKALEKKEKELEKTQESYRDIPLQESMEKYIEKFESFGYVQEYKKQIQLLNERIEVLIEEKKGVGQMEEEAASKLNFFDTIFQSKRKQQYAELVMSNQKLENEIVQLKHEETSIQAKMVAARMEYLTPFEEKSKKGEKCRVQLEKKISSLEKEISDILCEIEQKKEKLEQKQEDERDLKEKVQMLEKESEEFHKKYLLKKYRDYI